MHTPVTTSVEVQDRPADYKAGEMNAMAEDGNKKVAFITGVTGQDGSYLVELLLSKGYTELSSLFLTSCLAIPNVWCVFVEVEWS